MRRAAIAIVVSGLCGLVVIALWLLRRDTRVTWNRDLAPLVYRKCAPCHRPGQVAPFSLLGYADFIEHAHDIRDVVEDRIMPPWKPVGARNHFKGDRSLTDAEVALVLRFIDEGKLEGDPAQRPTPPKWPSGFQLGEPDAVARMAAPYELGPDGRDVYRNFVLPLRVGRKRYVVGWEFVPRSRAVHHAILYVDKLGIARQADARDEQPGFAGMDVVGLQAPDGHYLVWAPGKSFARSTDGTAWSLDPETDLVLQLHLQPTGKRERVEPEVALYFSDTPPTRALYSLRVGDAPIDIAPGQKDYRMNDALAVPVEVELLSLFPHAHYLATQMRLWAELPGGGREDLLRIDAWDFKWQDEYTYTSPPRLPAGSVIRMEFHYDNSADNPSNPSKPPVRVTTGEDSKSEMGNVTLQVAPVRRTDLDALREAKFRRELRLNDGALAHYNLANVLSRTGRTAEAIEHYQAALARQPDLDTAHYNLAGVLLGLGRLQEAVPHLRAVIEKRPSSAPTYVHLGRALIALGRRDEGLAALRRAVELDPGDAPARRVLEQAEAETGATPHTP